MSIIAIPDDTADEYAIESPCFDLKAPALRSLARSHNRDRRLATLRFDRDVTQELAAVTSAMEQLSPEPDDPWKQAAQFLRSMFSGEKNWRQWHDEIAPLYANNRWALGILASLASVLDSPLLQSLVSQIGLARTLEQVFKISPSIRGKFVAPFFTRYWQGAIVSDFTQFRRMVPDLHAPIGGQPVIECEWADKTKTLCTNPLCLAEGEGRHRKESPELIQPDYLQASSRSTNCRKSLSPSNRILILAIFKIFLYHRENPLRS